MLRFTATEVDTGTRLDSYVSSKIPSVSRSFIQKLEEQGKVLVNSSKARTSYKIRQHDVIEVDFDEATLENTPAIDMEVLYEDDDCLVINKPAGLLTHSKGAYNPEATVATFIHDKLVDLDGERAGIVHRLDRATSGVMITAKNPDALAWLQKHFSQRKVKKTYFAIVEGHLNPEQAVIDIPIERHPKTPKIFRTSVSGKQATTEYKVVKTSPNYSLVELRPKTGRTHQLRVHMSHLGHPIVGDSFYKGKSSNRLYLHANKLELTLPNRIRKVFEVQIPSEFNDILLNDG